MDDSEFEPGKIFVGGLSWETEEKSMTDYFEHFGKVTDCVVMRDQNQIQGMKRNKGFGFVKFEDPESVEKVVRHGVHILDNKKIDPKRASKKSGGKDTDKKVFLGGLSSNTTESVVKQYFSASYGGVVEVVFKTDRETSRKRGFGFVTFESPDLVDQVLKKQYHEIDGKMVEVKKAEPRSATASAMRQNPGMGPYGYHPYGQDFRGASNGHHYPSQYYHGDSQGYYPYGAAPPHAPGYGQQQYGSAPTGYTYDHTSAYPRTQTSAGDRQDSQAPYHQYNPYGHGGGQMGPGYGQNTTSYPGRAGYGGGQDGSYGHQAHPTHSMGGGYGQSGRQQQQPMHYGGGSGATGGYGH